MLVFKLIRCWEQNHSIVMNNHDIFQYVTIYYYFILLLCILYINIIVHRISLWLFAFHVYGREWITLQWNLKWHHRCQIYYDTDSKWCIQSCINTRLIPIILAWFTAITATWFITLSISWFWCTQCYITLWVSHDSLHSVLHDLFISVSHDLLHSVSRE